MPFFRILARSSVFVLLTMLVVTGAISAQQELTTPAPLEGTAWRLVDYRWRDVERSAGPEVAARLNLVGGQLRGSGGCNALKGRYATVGETIAFDLDDTARASCAEQTMIVELALLDGLRKADRFRVLAADSTSRPEFVLSDAAGLDLLRFTIDDASSLSRSEWRLAAYTAAGERVLADPSQPAVLTFNAGRENAARRRSDGSVVGSTGCNGIVAEYFQHASVLSFGALQVTDAPCTERAAAQEAAIVAVLDATSQSIELPPDRLSISSATSGDRLEFVTTTPREGSTWLLTRIPGSRRITSDITMRLADGLATGEGPCGPYSAMYQTEGTLLSFTDVAGSDTDGCTAVKLQRQLLNALRDTVLTDTTQPGLRLLDAFGRTTARFSHPGGP